VRCGAGGGWDGLRGGCGLEVCGAGKISQIPAGAERVSILRGGSGQKFQPAQDFTNDPHLTFELFMPTHDPRLKRKPMIEAILANCCWTFVLQYVTRDYRLKASFFRS